MTFREKSADVTGAPIYLRTVTELKITAVTVLRN
jgi:hypothetical protein